MHPPVFALLDDRDATAERPSSRLCTGFVREHRIVDPARLDALWAEVDAELRAGLHAVLLVDYEWGAKLLAAGHERLAADDASALRVLMFDNVRHCSRQEVTAWLGDGQESPEAAGVMALQPSVEHAEFVQAIARIHEAIRAGETYQVNYTYRLHGQAYGSPVDLFRRLRERQPVAYGALIALPAGGAITHVLSCSPELFLRHDDGLLAARPMKGTATRIDGAEGDSETARHLSLDTKNRAENLMIVDLLRNDLGRVAQTGTVQVPDLFVIEPYSTLFQMTSTVQARLRPDVGLPDLLRAVFPCGSITGAPKHHTMQLIDALESTRRGLYCGAIGWLDAPSGDARCGNFCLSVAIRTLTLGAERQGLWPAVLGVGAGIVLDSVADDEFEECRLKSRFLTSIEPGFELFETMLALPGRGVQHRDRHLDRLQHSAAVLGFDFERAQAEAVLHEAVNNAVLDAGGPRRIRLALSHDGRITSSQGPLPLLPRGEVGLLIAAQRLPEHRPLAAHKTTARSHYDAGVRDAEQAGAFDSLFFTADGRLVEGGRSTVCLRIDGHWFTPPVDDGALPGIMRSLLLEDPAWQLGTRSLGLDDLQRAEAMVVCNALRGVLPAHLVVRPGR